MNRTLLLIACLCMIAATPAFAIETLDVGTFEVYQDSRALGVESFAIERHRDSLFVYCEISQKIPTPDGERSLEKTMRLLTKEFDASLILYESVQMLDGAKLTRAIIPTDTAMTVYREDQRAGVANTLVLPPGRLFVIDPQVFTLFDVICRDLAPRVFDERRIQMFVLAAEDTTVEAVVTDMGKETIRWGAKPVQARKLRIADQTSEFFAMIGPLGNMLQLTQPATGLRVVRKAPDVKPRGSR